MNERELFLSALEIEDPAARRVHLQSVCGGDAGLLSRVESLLASHESQSQFLNLPVVDQIADDSVGEDDATLVTEAPSTHDEEPGAATTDAPQPDATMGHEDDIDDEIPLGYLQPSSRTDSLGRLGHYEIQEVVGRGAFGTVLKAFDEKLHRVVAIKVLAPEMAATSPARKRFKREARSSAQLRHDNVVSIYAVEDDPIPYLVMEYIPGQTLQQRLDETGPLNLPDVLQIGKQIADGLAAAHAQQLIHRDIKPLRGTGYRLPTEAEWEHACRAGTTTKFWCGEQDSDLVRAGWFAGNYRGRTHAAGELESNPFGLSNMHGNVWEWVQDSWEPTLEGTLADNVTIDPYTPFSAGSHRVLRGGHWGDAPLRCRSSARCAFPPPSVSFGIGFRAVLPVDAVKQAKLSSATVVDDYALSFDGKDDYVEIPSLQHDVNSPMTVETICRIVDLNRSTLVDLGSRETSEFVLRTDAQQWRFERSSGSKWTSTRGAQGFKPGPFVHIAGVWEGSQLRLFINGALQPGSNDTNKARSRTQLERLLIGGLGQGVGKQTAPPTEFFGGMIKGLRISKTARYTSGFTAPTDFKSDEQTLALYDFDTGSGNVLHDASTNGHHGKIIGATWVPVPVPQGDRNLAE
ncbi:MAG: hypothetical protein CMJ48_05240 [Planctomycetaceae bacterium]|nr:hypothetical protein [Planctomycetaceae bacterium]